MKIIVYSTPYCIYCKKLKEFFNGKKIKYEEYDISGGNNKAILEEMVKKSGQMGVPVTDIDGKIIVGFDRAEIEKILNLKS